MKSKLLLLGFLCLCLVVHSADTNKFPEIGKPCPPIFLKNLQYYTSTKQDINKLKGKWVILDFWHRNCASCVASFPDVNALQAKFKDQVQYFLIGRQDKEKWIQRTYERFRQKFNLNIAVSFDSSLHNRFEIYNCPYIIVIDDKGIVRALTLALTEKNLTDFLNHREPMLSKAFRGFEDPRRVFNANLPLLTDNNGGVDSNMLYRSVLLPWKNDEQDFRPITMDGYLNNYHFSGFQAMGADIGQLFEYAWLGFYEPEIIDSNYAGHANRPVFEISDSSRFKFDRIDGKHVYSYSLRVPRDQRSKEEIQRIMKNDLRSYFNMTATIEKRMMPVCKLVVIDSAKVNKIKGNLPVPSFIPTPHGQIGLTNQKPSEMLLQVFEAFPYQHYVDETGMDEPVTFLEDAVMSDFNEIRAALQKHGLDLVQGEKLLTVIVVRDAGD